QQVGQLGVAGGVSTGDTIRRVLTMLMTNSVAKQVNWKGTSGKEPFQQMRLKEVVIKAARKNPVRLKASDSELESHIKLWFRYAPDRDGGRRERTLLAKQKKSAAAAATAAAETSTE
ncbi:uncharacterized protein LOC124269518, partial [Haliotis rubra]|uniref:uncharacterized protein LOC124269518 n=1 Tax=Haliotis rubra TaxID=36100 RepID=UPI001EE57671